MINKTSEWLGEGIPCYSTGTVLSWY